MRVYHCTRISKTSALDVWHGGKKKKKDHVYAAVKFWFSITSPDLHIDDKRQQGTILIYTKFVIYLKKKSVHFQLFSP